MSYIE